MESNDNVQLVHTGLHMAYHQPNVMETHWQDILLQKEVRRLLPSLVHPVVTVKRAWKMSYAWVWPRRDITLIKEVVILGNMNVAEIWSIVLRAHHDQTKSLWEISLLGEQL
jgi:hypothetical protein